MKERKKKEQSASKTNAMRMLDTAKIPYEALEYEVDEKDLSGVHIAESLDFPPEQMFKTLVARGDKSGVAVFCIPVAEELNLKYAASVSGNKRLELLPVKELLGVTGYIRGGCSPIGMKKKFPTWVDESALQFERITVSAGVRGIQLLLDRDALLQFIQANVAPLTAKS